MQRKIVLASLLLKHFIAESRVRSPQVRRSHSCRARPKAAELGEPVRMRPTVEADGRETGAEGPLASSVGLRTRRRCPQASPSVRRRPASLWGRRGGTSWESGCASGWVHPALVGSYTIRILEVGEIEGGRKAWGTVPATRHRSVSGRIGTAGVLVAQSHVGITCYPVNNIIPIRK